MSVSNCLSSWGQISTGFPQSNLCKLKIVSIGIVKVSFLDPETTELIRSSYHNDQGRWSYKTPNEVGVKSEPTSAMKHKGEKAFKVWVWDIHQE